MITHNRTRAYETVCVARRGPGGITCDGLIRPRFFMGA